MSRSYNRLVLLAVLAMLTFALTNLQAQSSATNSAPPTATTDTNAPARPISDAQFKKILADAQIHGKVRPTSSEVTTAFGITHKGETLTLRQDTFLDAEQNHHALVELNNGNYFFGFKNAQDSYIYYTDKNLNLISALVNSASDGITIIPNKDAQAGLDTELKFFANIANQL